MDGILPSYLADNQLICFRFPFIINAIKPTTFISRGIWQRSRGYSFSFQRIILSPSVVYCRFYFYQQAKGQTEDWVFISFLFPQKFLIETSASDGCGQWIWQKRTNKQLNYRSTLSPVFSLPENKTI